MNSLLATVNNILTYSCVDGPGNRLVIFLQGCNFNCPTCHNPYTIGLCNHCGDCVPACHVNALEMVDGRVVFDPTTCDQCDACLDICPISASPMVQRVSVADILEIARKNKPFLSGVTVSGGEATLQLKFVIALFKAIKADPALKGLTCFVDTNGHLGTQSWERLLPVTDGIMLDIKAFDPALHHVLTGQGNAKTLKAAKTVHDAGKLYELRFLVIPGKTDTNIEINHLTNFTLSLGFDIRVRLNAFQRHGVRAEAREQGGITEASMNRIAEHLRKAGITEVITPALYL
ncbi:MAG: YjjW family glycine radical enzyme activase [Paracoccaceae bacterium]